MIGLLERLKGLLIKQAVPIKLGSECPLFGQHKTSPIRRGYPQVICKCGAIGVTDIKVGRNTISLSPGGTDVIRWSATQLAVAAGDLGMDVATGELSTFISGSARAVLTTFSNQQSLFTFTHIAGAASTGALGFTPRFAIYTGVAEDGGAAECAAGTSVITGTGTSARYAGSTFPAAIGVNTTGTVNFDADAAIKIGAAGAELDVTAFSAAGITLTWSAGVGVHNGFLLVVG